MNNLYPQQVVHLTARLTNHEEVTDSFPLPPGTQRKIEVTMDLRPRVTKLLATAKLSDQERRTLCRLLYAADTAAYILEKEQHIDAANALMSNAMRVNDIFDLKMTENKG